MEWEPLGREQSRRVDSIAIDTYGIPGIVLMENAAREAARIIHDRVPTGTILILAGGGNNGGDGYAIARHLIIACRKVRVIAAVPTERLRGDAATNAAIVKAMNVPVDEIAATCRPDDAVEVAEQRVEGIAAIIDCLLGTGASGDPREPIASLVRWANASRPIRIAIDSPTGLDVDTGVAGEPTFRADHTITFVAKKIGFAAAAQWTGAVEVAAIGVPPAVVASAISSPTT